MAGSITPQQGASERNSGDNSFATTPVTPETSPWRYDWNRRDPSLLRFGNGERVTGLITPLSLDTKPGLANTRPLPEQETPSKSTSVVPPPSMQAWLDRHGFCVQPKDQARSRFEAEAIPKLDRPVQPLPPIRSPMNPPVQPTATAPIGRQPLFSQLRSPTGPSLGFNRLNGDLSNGGGSSIFHQQQHNTPALQQTVNEDTSSPSIYRHRRNSASWPSVFASSPKKPLNYRTETGTRPNLQRLCRQYDALMASSSKASSPLPLQPFPKTGAFRPMAAINDFDSRRRPMDSPNFDPASFSVNYRGEHNVRNASATHLAPEENCALWLTNLPPDASHTELLACIRNVGRIWCTVINEPDYEKHTTAAAKVVFFTPNAAQLLLAISLTTGLRVRNHQVKVTHNRVKYGAQMQIGDATRVLIVTGKSTFVNEASLTIFFKERFVFEADEVITLVSVRGRSVIEYRFGSYRCQAQMGKMALEKDKPEGLEKVEFGQDPCEVGDSLVSYGIAGERIQGKGI